MVQELGSMNSCMAWTSQDLSWPLQSPEAQEAEVWSAVRGAVLAEACPHLEKQGGVLEVISAQTCLSGWQHHPRATHRWRLARFITILPTLPSTFSYLPLSGQHTIQVADPFAQKEDAHGPICPFSCDIRPVWRDEFSGTKRYSSPNMPVCHQPFKYELEGGSGISSKTRSRRHLMACPDPSWGGHDKWKTVLCPNPFVH